LEAQRVRGRRKLQIVALVMALLMALQTPMLAATDSLRVGPLMLLTEMDEMD
jgi:hypothetical protein